MQSNAVPVSRQIQIREGEILELTHRLAKTHATLQNLVDDQIRSLIAEDATWSPRLQLARDQLRQSKELLTAMFNGIRSCIAYLDCEFNIIRVNQAFAELDHRSPIELPGANYFDLYPDPENQEIFRQVLQTGEAYKANNRPLIYSANSERGTTYCDWSLQPVADGSGHVEGLVLVLDDITEQVTAAQNLREQTGLVRLLQDIAIAANEAHSQEDALQRAIDRICAYTGWTVGHAILSVRGEVLTSARVWQTHRPPELEPFIEQSHSLQWTLGEGLPGRVLQTGRPAWFSDVLQEQSFLRRETASQAGLRSCFAFPVFIGNEVVGVLEFFSKDNIEQDNHFLELLPSIGTQLGQVVERQRSESYLQAQQALLNEVLDRLPVGVWVADGNGKILLGNPAGHAIWAGSRYVGIEQFGLYKAWWLETGQPVEAHDWALARAVERGETSLNELLEIECFDGTHKIIVNSAIPLRNPQGEIIGAIVVNQDITERRRMESELAEVQRRLLSGLEAERSRLAQDLHDGPMQDLYGVIFQIQSLEEELHGRSSQSTAAESRLTLQNIIETLRAICTDLRPPTLAPFGLEKAIRSYVDSFKQKNPNLTVYLDLDSDRKILAEEARLALYRNCQQLLNNVVRHAQAHAVWIRLKLVDGQILLEVEDDGRGFDPRRRWIELARQGNLGLIGASERAEVLGGHLEIVSSPGSGALVRTVIPIPDPG